MSRKSTKASLPEAESETPSMKDFETIFQRLQEIVRELESGTVTLDQGMQLFQEGVRCSNACRSMLETARHTLHKWQNGEAEPIPLPADEQGEAF
ncbi:MAG: exodeoxyribonuclease VII small subunit [Desulfovibrio sp.]|nr:exodeoxyribonuclease VII small subunit [Desulfovibrio sp.]